MNKGIDYSLGMANVDHETGIHYGVINQNEVLQAWADSSEPVYYPYCPYCGEEIANEYEDMIELEKCPKCEHEFDDMSFDDMQPQTFKFIDDGYICQQYADDTDIFVIKSPYFTYCQFCSPCAPGAGYLMNVRDKETGIKAYCFGHDWFENENAPYLVFSVETGELVEPEK